MTNSTRTGPLQDITIIDCTMAYAGPFGTALLADMGANVIKVEPPRGDNFRVVPPFPPDYAHPWKRDEEGVDYGMAFAGVNRNKRSVCLNLKAESDRDALLQMCEQADAVVENMRAGVMDDLGVGYEVISARNPKIVYGAVRGYGDPRTGESPYSDWPCLDVAGQGASGLVEASGELYSLAISDMYPGTLMALGLLAAVHKARNTGVGEFFDVAMYDAGMALLRSNVASYSLTKKVPRPGIHSLVPFGLFPASDGRVALAAPVERHWVNLCEAMERPDLLTDERTNSNPRRAKNKAFAEAQVAAWTSNLTKQQLVDMLGGKVPIGPANTIAEVFEDPHVAAREILESYQLPGDNPEVELAGSPIRFTHSQTGLYQSPPLLGEHQDEVMAEFGIANGTLRQDA